MAAAVISLLVPLASCSIKGEPCGLLNVDACGGKPKPVYTCGDNAGPLPDTFDCNVPALLPGLVSIVPGRTPGPDMLCGVFMECADEEAARANAKKLAGTDANLVCELVHAGPITSDDADVTAPPEWLLPGGCVRPTVGADAGAMCSMLGQICNNSADVAQEHTCCPGVVCSADEMTEDAVGVCCALPSSAAAGVRCGADTDCCQAAVGMAICREGACCYDLGAQCSLAADECCAGLTCQDTGTGEPGYGTCEP